MRPNQHLGKGKTPASAEKVRAPNSCAARPKHKNGAKRFCNRSTTLDNEVDMHHQVSERSGSER